MRITSGPEETWRKIEITKTTAAQRQLDQAIRLFFLRGDMLSVHTLAGAAFQLLSDIGAPRGIESRLRLSDRIKPEHQGEWIKAPQGDSEFPEACGKGWSRSHAYLCGAGNPLPVV